MARSQEMTHRRKQTEPVSFPMTEYMKADICDTSARAGKTYPAGFIPLMPRDSVKAGSRAELVVQQEEMEKVIGNAVHFRAAAYFVSYAALDRFDGMDSVAYGWAERSGAPAIKDMYTYSAASHLEFYKAYGEHIKPGESVDSLYVQAYNAVINHRRELVSKSLPIRDNDDHSIARCLWGETALARVVPDFDAAMIESAVPLDFTAATLPVEGRALVKGFGVASSSEEVGMFESNTSSSLTTDGSPSPPGPDTGRKMYQVLDTSSSTNPDGFGAIRPVYADAEDAWSDLTVAISGNAGSISLAQINNATKIQQFARMRSLMAGNDEDLIDLLMRGVRIPRAAYNDPILLGRSDTVINQDRRYATDGANLDQMAVNGAARLTVPISMPEQDTGGCIVVVYEIVPEPVFDRQADMFLRAGFDDLPNALRDYLDTQPVEEVPNRFVDALHSTPDGTFGYAPLNYWMAQKRIRAGGRHYRDLSVSETDEDQLYIWSVRSVDPQLNEDTFLVPDGFSHYVFQDTLSDPFLVRSAHMANIRGITQFGAPLYEASGDYAAVASELPDSSIAPPSSS